MVSRLTRDGQTFGKQHRRQIAIAKAFAVEGPDNHVPRFHVPQMDELVWMVVASGRCRTRGAATNILRGSRYCRGPDCQRHHKADPDFSAGHIDFPSVLGLATQCFAFTKWEFCELLDLGEVHYEA